jgi:hypothetical protein
VFTLNMYRKIITNPVFYTVIFGSVFLYLLPFDFSKTNVSLMDSRRIDQHQETFYHDLNGNGLKETIHINVNNNDKNCPIVLVMDEDGLLLKEWNPKGSWLDIHIPVFGDYDNDGLEEMYTVTKSNDSLFLYGIEFFGEKEFIIRHKFIAKSNYNQTNDIDVFLFGGKVMSPKKNASKKVYFYLGSGYSGYPRNLFCYDIQNQTINSSPKSGAGFSNYVHFADIDNDSIDEIFGMVTSPDNYTEDIPYRDNNGYLMVFDTNLKFKFKPVKFEGDMCTVDPCHIVFNNENYFACLYQIRTVEEGSIQKLFFIHPWERRFLK